MRFHARAVRCALLAGAAACLGLSPAAAQTKSVYIDQVGSGNLASVQQSGEASESAPLTGSLRQSGDNAIAAVTQSGEGNQFEVDQSGEGAHGAAIDQSGAQNFASIAQSGPGANIAAILQGGSGNRATIHQTSVVSGNTASISQGGEDNSAALRQNGDDNSASLSQSGRSNSADFNQTGNGNALGGSQSGDNNSLTLRQIGNGLTAPTVTQTGDSHISVTQTMIAPSFILPK